MHPRLLLILYLGVIFAPFGLAHLQGLPRRPIQDELSSGLALVAFAIILIEFVLSGRFQTISARIGMDVTMRFHQLLARTALAAIALHPFLYSAPLNPPLPWDVTRQSTLGLDGPSIVTGLVAYFLLPALVLTAVFRDQLGWKYEAWRLAHGVGAFLIALAGAHHSVQAGRYSSEPLLAGYWFFLLALAVGSLAWIYAVKPLYQLLHPYTVKSVHRIAERTWEIVIEPEGRSGLRFAAGQFVWLNIGNSPFLLNENPFSVSSAPRASADTAFVIKEVGDFTRSIGTIKPGTRAYVDGPHGNLTLDGRRGKGVALIAGGVGIAPLLSILRDLVQTGDRRPIMLVYGNRKQDQIVYEAELARFNERKNISIVHVLSEPPPGWQGSVGVLDADLIRSQFGFEDAGAWLYLICGPPAMMQACEKALIALGVPSKQIVSERFQYD